MKFEWGIRSGLPRLIKLFRKYGWRWTTWACARSFEVTGPYPKMLLEDGHEVCGSTLDYIQAAPTCSRSRVMATVGNYRAETWTNARRTFTSLSTDCKLSLV